MAHSVDHLAVENTRKYLCAGVGEGNWVIDPLHLNGRYP